MEATRAVIDAGLVRRLVAARFPHWAGLPIRPIEPGGWDNRTFRLGEHLIVRLPSAADYAQQAEKTHRWLPRLAPALPFSIPVPVALGEPAEGYPFPWSVHLWIEGEVAAPERIADSRRLANDLGHFLAALQRIDTTGGPAPGVHNFHRGGSLATYDDQTRKAIATLRDRIDAAAATCVWDAALATSWRDAPVWVHGDVSLGNLLIRSGYLTAVIDFGNLAVGDPACDLAIAWNVFDVPSRAAFRTALPLDGDTWMRGRAWALWKALIVAAGIAETNAIELAQPLRIVDEVLADAQGGSK